ncbi:hypothetical protein PQ459_09605 [Chryseobacterium sp. KACC 21268]|nr:hypothetical protein PQ459_09605 [Chryseobacterium sp. KACC 21268]
MKNLETYPDEYISSSVTSEIKQSLNDLKKEIKGLLILLFISVISVVGLLVVLVFQDIYNEKLIETNTVIRDNSPDSLMKKILDIRNVNDSTVKYSYAVDDVGKIITYHQALKKSDSLINEINSLLDKHNKTIDSINKITNTENKEIRLKTKPLVDSIYKNK